MEPTLIKNNKIFNNQKKVIVTLIILAICLFIGTSYSLLTSRDETDEVITFQAGDLNLEVKTNNDAIVNLEDELPKSEEEVEKPIILNIKNTSSLTICEYRLKLIPDTSDTTPASDLPTNYIRYAVSEDNGVSYKESKLLSETNNQIYVGFNLKPGETDNPSKPGETKTIYVKVWLDETALDNEEVLNKHFYGKIDAELLQRCEVATEYLKTTLGKTGGIIGVTNDSQKVTEETSNIREYRYSGLGVNNYVTFNNETWRIIGIFKGDDGQDHVKLVRNSILTTQIPDTYIVGDITYYIRAYVENIDYEYVVSCNSSTTGKYENDWTKAGLMNWLNSKGTTNGYLKMLTDEAQNMIYETTWYLGNNRWGQDTVTSAYTNERTASNVHSGNQATWKGKIALMYPSDYGFSTDSSCWNSDMNVWDITQLNLTWLKEGFTTPEWLLSPNSLDATYFAVWNVGGNVGFTGASWISAVRPSLYLKSDVVITSGKGTSTDPYVLQ